MEIFIQEILIYGFAVVLILTVLYFYIRKQRRQTKAANEKLQTAIEAGSHEPVSLYPIIDPNRCIGSGACVKACPEHDILGIRHGKGTVINASQCIGHGACFRSCPVEAISLWIGTETRGVELPHVSPTFETNIQGIFIAGELGGMGLIRNAVKQGKEAVENLVKTLNRKAEADYDLIVVGAGPAGISATLEAKKEGLNVLILEQDTLGGTVFTYPRSKIVMTHPMELPLYGKLKFRETSKDELLQLWEKLINKYSIEIKERHKVDSIDKKENGTFELKTTTGETFNSRSVVLALGRRGTPRKLNIPGEMSKKVAYRLLDHEEILDKKIVVVGGGDSAVEAALMLANKNNVILSYRGEKFKRLKVKNAAMIESAMTAGMLEVQFNTNLTAINPENVLIKNNVTDIETVLDNDLVYIFAGGELPSGFLKKCGIKINTKNGEVVFKH